MHQDVLDSTLLDQGHRKGLEAGVGSKSGKWDWRLVPVECWDHCSGKSNPADIPSHGLSSVELLVNELWKHGPVWLQQDLDTSILPLEISEACANELRSSGVLCLMISMHTTAVSSVVDCNRYSSVHKLRIYIYGITAYVLKFIDLLKNRDHSFELTLTDLARAKRLWILEWEAALMKDKNFPTWKSQFDLYLDENQLWRY